jgi:hypothetical protein
VSRFARPALRILGVVAALAALPRLIGAIYVSPTTVFIDERARATQITVGNPGDQAEEAAIELKFGFTDADSAGTPYVRFVEDPGPEFPSAAEWIRSFPQRFRLEAGTQQVVRLLARPPDSLPDGEYWTRMVVTGRRAAPDITAAGAGEVRAGLSLEIRLIATVLYRKGRVTTGIEIRDLSAEPEGDSLGVWVNLARTGNAAWHGMADVEVVRGGNERVRRWSVPLAVYYPLRRRFVFPLQQLEPGDYRVRFRMRAERSDLPRERVLRAPPVTDSVAVRIL